ncbi:hypothetical protein [Streptomyces sp. NBC_00932]|uniref:hypothetical protein n=1 Tax=Streptomyces sp. NBC_00932 TaxID=2903690 RepID=UPI00386C1904|nr:hypothetical protein OG221_27880 [Streptomyces sp. NBC_00932]
MKSAHTGVREMAAALKRQVVKTGSTTASVRGSDWHRAVVAAVGIDGTITTADGIVALRDERYQAPAVGDIIRVSISSSGSCAALGRLAGTTAPTGAWTPIPLASGFTTPHSGMAAAQYRVITVAGQGRVELQGGVDATTAVTTQTSWSIALPAAARPGVLRTFVGRRNYGATTVGAIAIEISTGGVLSVFGSNPPTTTWFALDGSYYDL